MIVPLFRYTKLLVRNGHHTARGVIRYA